MLWTCRDRLDSQSQGCLVEIENQGHKMLAHGRSSGPGHCGTPAETDVRDHGAGVPEDERSRIFEVFYRGIAGRKAPGMGVYHRN